MRMSTLSNNLLSLVRRKIKKFYGFPKKKKSLIICSRLYGTETHCAHVFCINPVQFLFISKNLGRLVLHNISQLCKYSFAVYVGDDSNFGMFRSTLDYYRRLVVITNILCTYFLFVSGLGMRCSNLAKRYKFLDFPRTF